jgi:hypothetical protein
MGCLKRNWDSWFCYEWMGGCSYLRRPTPRSLNGITE